MYTVHTLVQARLLAYQRHADVGGVASRAPRHEYDADPAEGDGGVGESERRHPIEVRDPPGNHAEDSVGDADDGDLRGEDIKNREFPLKYVRSMKVYNKFAFLTRKLASCTGTPPSTKTCKNSEIVLLFGDIFFYRGNPYTLGHAGQIDEWGVEAEHAQNV